MTEKNAVYRFLLKNLHKPQITALGSALMAGTIALMVEYLTNDFQKPVAGLWGAGIGFVVASVISRFIREYYNIIIEQKQEIIKQQEVIREQENHLREIQTAQKEKLIADYLRNLQQKNEIIEELRNQLSNQQEEEIERLSSLISARLLSDSDWEEFKQNFDEVHKGFLLRLRAFELSPAETRLAALMRLKLGTKEIAAILAVSPQSVNMARYRLKQKLDLKDQDLQDFIETI